jgi:hypothetical protein
MVKSGSFSGGPGGLLLRVTGDGSEVSIAVDLYLSVCRIAPED